MSDDEVEVSASSEPSLPCPYLFAQYYKVQQLTLTKSFQQSIMSRNLL